MIAFNQLLGKENIQNINDYGFDDLLSIEDMQKNKKELSTNKQIDYIRLLEYSLQILKEVDPISCQNIKKYLNNNS